MVNEIKDNIKDKLDPRVIFALIIVGVYEFEVFTYAKGTVQIAQRDAWISVLLGGLIIIFVAYLWILLAARFPGKNILQYNKKVWGKPVSFIIALGYLLFWFFYLTIILENVSMTNKVLFLPTTPLIITIILLALGAVWLIFYGFASVTRFFHLMLPFMVIPFLFLSILVTSNINLGNLLPVLGNGFLPILKGAIYYLGVNQGLEVVLFISPFIINPKDLLKPALIALIAMVVFDVIMVTSIIGILGVEVIKESSLPGVDAIRTIQLPGFPVERFELFLTMPWVVGSFTTICLYLYLLSYGMMQIFNLNNKKVTIYVIATLIVLVTYFYPNTAWALTVANYMNVVTTFFLYVIPILTLLMAIFRGKEGYR